MSQSNPRAFERPKKSNAANKSSKASRQKRFYVEEGKDGLWRLWADGEHMGDYETKRQALLFVDMNDVYIKKQRDEIVDVRTTNRIRKTYTSFIN